MPNALIHQNNQVHSPLLKLPLELRLKIYHALFESCSLLTTFSRRILHDYWSPLSPRRIHAIVNCVCSQVRDEATPALASQLSISLRGDDLMVRVAGAGLRLAESWMHGVEQLTVYAPLFEKNAAGDRSLRPPQALLKRLHMLTINLIGSTQWESHITVDAINAYEFELPQDRAYWMSDQSDYVLAKTIFAYLMGGMGEQRRLEETVWLRELLEPQVKRLSQNVGGKGHDVVRDVETNLAAVEVKACINVVYPGYYYAVWLEMRIADGVVTVSERFVNRHSR